MKLTDAWDLLEAMLGSWIRTHSFFHCGAYPAMSPEVLIGLE